MSHTTKYLAHQHKQTQRGEGLKISPRLTTALVVVITQLHILGGAAGWGSKQLEGLMEDDMEGRGRHGL